MGETLSSSLSEASGEETRWQSQSTEDPKQASTEDSEGEKPWHTFTAQNLKRTVLESTDSAFRSARSLQNNSSTHFRTLQDFIPKLKSQYNAYEDAFFKKMKDGIMSAKEHPASVGGVAVTACLLLMQGPRRLFLRHTLWRLQSEEAQFTRAEKNIKELSLSVDLMKKESRKLLERSSLAERDMKWGHDELMSSGSQIQRLAKSFYKIEVTAADLMNGLRELPGRDALQLRAEVASMASLLKQHRTALDKRTMKISELGIPI